MPLSCRPERQAKRISVGFARMFQKPDKAGIRKLRELIQYARDQTLKQEEKSNEIVSQDDAAMNSRIISQLITNNFSNPLITETIPLYIQLVCEFVNESSSKIDGIAVPKCVVLDPMFNLILQTSDFPLAAKILTQNIITPRNFHSLSHIFLTIAEKHSDDSGHIFLIIISPKAKTIDYLNSHNPSTSTQPRRHLRLIFKFLEFYFSDKDSSRFDRAEWKVRMGKSPIQAPGSNDCGVWVCTVALGVALGYGVIDLKRGWDVRKRRLRMAVELMGGDASSWGYDVLEGVGGGNDVKDGWTCFDGRPGRTTC